MAISLKYVVAPTSQRTLNQRRRNCEKSNVSDTRRDTSRTFICPVAASIIGAPSSPSTGSRKRRVRTIGRVP